MRTASCSGASTLHCPTLCADGAQSHQGAPHAEWPVHLYSYTCGKTGPSLLPRSPGAPRCLLIIRVTTNKLDSGDVLLQRRCVRGGVCVRATTKEQSTAGVVRLVLRQRLRVSDGATMKTTAAAAANCCRRSCFARHNRRGMTAPLALKLLLRVFLSVS